MLYFIFLHQPFFVSYNFLKCLFIKSCNVHHATMSWCNAMVMNIFYCSCMHNTCFAAGIEWKYYNLIKQSKKVASKTSNTSCSNTTNRTIYLSVNLWYCHNEIQTAMILIILCHTIQYTNLWIWQTASLP